MYLSSIHIMRFSTTVPDYHLASNPVYVALLEAKENFFSPKAKNQVDPKERPDYLLRSSFQDLMPGSKCSVA